VTQSGGDQALMAKYRLAKSRKQARPSARGAVPCIILIITGMALLFFLFYAILKSV
jgi:hypothetical protein